MRVPHASGVGDCSSPPSGEAEERRRLSASLERILNAITAGLLAILTFAIVYQVFGRYVLNRAPSWSEELAGFLMAWITMVSAAALIRGNSHIAVTVLVDRLPPGLAAALATMRDCLILTAAGLLAYYGTVFAQFGLAARASATEIPMAWPYAAVPVGGLLIAAMLVIERLEELSRKRKRG